MVGIQAVKMFEKKANELDLINLIKFGLFFVLNAINTISRYLNPEEAYFLNGDQVAYDESFNVKKALRRLVLTNNIERVLIQQIGTLSIFEQYKILECLLDKGDRFLFHRNNTKLTEITPSQLIKLKNEIFEDFCDDILFFVPGNKEKLISNIMNILGLCNIKYKCETSTELLYSKLLTQDKEVVNWVETDEIKQMIFEMYNFNNDDLDEKKARDGMNVLLRKLSTRASSHSLCSVKDTAQSHWKK